MGAPHRALECVHSPEIVIWRKADDRTMSESMTRSTHRFWRWLVAATFAVVVGLWSTTGAFAHVGHAQGAPKASRALDSAAGPAIGVIVEAISGQVQAPQRAALPEAPASPTAASCNGGCCGGVGVCCGFGVASPPAGWTPHRGVSRAGFEPTPDSLVQDVRPRGLRRPPRSFV